MKHHGYRYHPLYAVWRSMKQRCCNKNHKQYDYYGERGISVCDEWRNSAKIFIEWCLSNGWEKGLTIDRRNNDGNYCPENCRFVTPTENTHNQRLLWKTNTSGYRGVSWKKDKKKWVASIEINGKSKHLGYFDSAKLAAIRYDVRAYLNGDNRPRNFIPRKVDIENLCLRS